MKLIIYPLLLVAFCFCSCNTKPKLDNPDVKTDYGTPVKSPDSLMADYQSWWGYHYHHIILSQDFIAVDESGNETDKRTFLEKMKNGQFYTIEMKGGKEFKNETVYQLYPVPATASTSIASTLKNVVATQLLHLYWVGKKFPTLAATTLEDVPFDNNTLKSSTTVLKTWFINCTACVKEFPELNQMVRNYGNKNVQFISLATDAREELKEFLDKREFLYSTIPVSEDFITNQLYLRNYPTHAIIDRQGIVRKVVGSARELENELEKYYAQLDKDSKRGQAPPPDPSL
ncbi:MAG: TlpA disulfide reductase family protein [Nonlabens sp.]